MRFLLFGTDEYYPQGGWGDFVSAHESAEAAREAARQFAVGQWSSPEDFQIVDLEVLKIVETLTCSELRGPRP